MKTISIMGANAIELACREYGDATAFVQILQANQIEDDWFINEPVVTSAAASANVGDTMLVIPPNDDIQIEYLVWSPSITAYSVVTSVVQNFQLPGGQAFCLCSVAGEPVRRLPNLGTWLSTTLTISPSLDFAVHVGTPLTFSVGQGVVLALSSKPPVSQNGVPS